MCRLPPPAFLSFSLVWSQHDAHTKLVTGSSWRCFSTVWFQGWALASYKMYYFWCPTLLLDTFTYCWNMHYVTVQDSQGATWNLFFNSWEAKHLLIDSVSLSAFVFGNKFIFSLTFPTWPAFSSQGDRTGNTAVYPDLKVQCVTCLVVHYQNLCCLFTNVSFLINISHHHQFQLFLLAWNFTFAFAWPGVDAPYSCSILKYVSR